EGALGIQVAVRDDALPLPKEVRQHPRIDDRHRMLEVRHLEAHLQASRRALHAALLHHTAEPEMLIAVDLARGDLRGNEIKSDVLAERGERECTRDTDAHQNSDHEKHATFARSHACVSSTIHSSRMAMRRLASERARAMSRRAQ